MRNIMIFMILNTIWLISSGCINNEDKTGLVLPLNKNSSYFIGQWKMKYTSKDIGFFSANVTFFKNKEIFVFLTSEKNTFKGTYDFNEKTIDLCLLEKNGKKSRGSINYRILNKNKFIIFTKDEEIAINRKL